MSAPPGRPELLAPAGDEPALLAALASGADAVYFGLDDGFNARARAKNFPIDDLERIVRRVHDHGARAYLTLNTLVFESELPAVEGILRRVVLAGVDAVIVQDPAVALLARALGLEVHASTQMTISSPEAARFAEGLGVSRIVAPRELSIAEIARLRAETPLELEVFVHGALCVAWSGQCLSSEVWGGRSANRGECAQACRMPYDLVVDGERRELGEVRYLLSPKDLAGIDHVGALGELGVKSLKIEGRQKDATYVRTAVEAYRRARDGEPSPDARAALGTAFSRGFTPGFFGGPDHQELVEGRFPKHRGVLLGRVAEVVGREVRVTRAGRVSTGGLAIGAPGAVEPAAAFAVAAGMGVVFDQGAPEGEEPGGPVFRVREDAGELWLGFGRPGPDLGRVRVGDLVFVNGDPKQDEATARLLARPAPRPALELSVAGALGGPLEVEGRYRGRVARVRSEGRLAAALGAGLDAALLKKKLTGGGAFLVEAVDASRLAPGLHLPVSELKALGRALATALDESPGPPELPPDGVASRLAAELGVSPDDGPAALVALCRSEPQLEAAIAAGVGEVELDFMELVGLGRAVARARAAGLRVGVATVRIQKPGEEGYDRRIARLSPDVVLVRHFGALMSFAEGRAAPESPRPELHGDFSLNVTNSITGRRLLSLGLCTVTAAHDLDRAQLLALLRAMPRGRVAVTIHHHIPTFHTEHCVYAHLLSTGRDDKTCGRPCERHEVALADRVGLVHPVLTDVGCRNTVFNAQAQSAASLVPELRAAGVRRLRVELVREGQPEAERVLSAYRALLAGHRSPEVALAEVRAHEQFGVTRGTMRVLRVV